MMWYANPILRLGASRRLEESDCLALSVHDVPSRIREAFEGRWRLLGAKTGLRRVLWAEYRGTLIRSWLGVCFFIGLTVAAPLTIRWLVVHVSSGERDGSYRTRGFSLVALLMVVLLMDAVVRAHVMREAGRRHLGRPPRGIRARRARGEGPRARSFEALARA